MSSEKTCSACRESKPLTDRQEANRLRAVLREPPEDVLAAMYHHPLLAGRTPEVRALAKMLCVAFAEKLFEFVLSGPDPQPPVQPGSWAERPEPQDGPFEVDDPSTGEALPYPETGERGPRKRVRVWIDRQHYDFNKRIVTGARLRQAADIPDDFDLWYEAPTPDREDVRVPEDQGFALLDGAHFYSSPRTILAGSEPLQDGGEREAMEGLIGKQPTARNPEWERLEAIWKAGARFGREHPHQDVELRAALQTLLEWAEHGEGEAPSGIRRTAAIERGRAALTSSPELATTRKQDFSPDEGGERCSKSSICVLGDGHTPPCKFLPRNLLADRAVDTKEQR